MSSSPKQDAWYAFPATVRVSVPWGSQAIQEMSSVRRASPYRSVSWAAMEGTVPAESATASGSVWAAP